MHKKREKSSKNIKTDLKFLINVKNEKSMIFRCIFAVKKDSKTQNLKK